MNPRIKSSHCILFFLLLLASCSSTPTNPESWIEFHKNACLPTAIIYKKNLDEKGVPWSKIVTYTYKNKNIGHAIVAYLYPPGENQLWTYDYWGSYRARAYINQPTEIAKQAEKRRGRDPDEVLSGVFLD